MTVGQCAWSLRTKAHNPEMYSALVHQVHLTVPADPRHQLKKAA
jgi:hypothetical protein